MELVESMADHYLRLHAEIKEKKAEFEKAQDVLMKYFVATGTESIPVNGVQIVHTFQKETNLNIEYLLKKYKAQWHLFSKPQIALLHQAIKDGVVDPTDLEKAKETVFQHRIRIKKEGGKDANQKPNEHL
jgi:hypothetical protein